ncbi:MAG: flagellar export chaperone FlgN, partial [Peptostreptococcaceae bacterium]
MLTLLKEILHEEINTVKSLLNLLEEQHSYLVNQEVFNLDGIIPKIEEGCKLVAASESKRRKLVGSKSMNLIVDEFKDIELQELHENLLGLLQEASV